MPQSIPGAGSFRGLRLDFNWRTAEIRNNITAVEGNRNLAQHIDFMARDRRR